MPFEAGRSRILSGAGIVIVIVTMLLALLAPPASASAGATSVRAAQTTVTARVLTTAYSIPRCGNTSGRVLLTFDDWAYGDPYRATRVGAYLKSRGIRAAFFLIEKFARAYPDIVRTLRSQGHWVANHTWSHPDLTTLSNAAVTSQIQRGIRSNLLRPPYGAYSTRVRSLASSLGYRLCTWTVDPQDWAYVHGARRSVSSIRSRIRSAPRSAKASGVILGHLFTDYPAAIPGIIADLHAQGLLFCRDRGPVGRDVPFPLAC